MKEFGLLLEIKQNVLSQISLKEIDDLIKNNIGRNDTYAKLLSAVGSSTVSYVKKLNEVEFDLLKRYVTYYIADNSKNIVGATMFEDGFVAADALVEMEICRFIQNYNPSLQDYMQKDKKEDSKEEPSGSEMGN